MVQVRLAGQIAFKLHPVKLLHLLLFVGVNEGRELRNRRCRRAPTGLRPGIVRTLEAQFVPLDRAAR